MIPLVSLQQVSASTPTTAQDAARHRQLVDAAQQFEAMFLKEMLKPMNSLGKSDDQSDGDDNPDGGSNGTMGSMGVESMALAISRAGGFGIAQHIVSQVEREHAADTGEKSLTSPKVG